MTLFETIKANSKWLSVFVICQLVMISINYRNIESVFFPVVTELTLVESATREGIPGMVVFVSFEKLRGCEFIGLQVSDNIGNRVSIDFQDVNETDDNYFSRPVGDNIAGPWWIDTQDWEGIRISAVHHCDHFGYTISKMK